jgi:hypothetical protein
VAPRGHSPNTALVAPKDCQGRCFTASVIGYARKDLHAEGLGARLEVQSLPALLLCSTVGLAWRPAMLGLFISCLSS